MHGARHPLPSRLLLGAWARRERRSPPCREGRAASPGSSSWVPSMARGDHSRTRIRCKRICSRT